MVRTDLLRKAIAVSGLTQAQVASRIGVTTRTFYKRMKTGVFRSDEIEAMVDMLRMKDPMAVFFGTESGEGGAADGASV